MKYSYENKIVTLDDELVKGYESFTGGTLSDSDISYFLRLAQRADSSIDPSALCGEALSEILKKQMEEEMSY